MRPVRQWGRKGTLAIFTVVVVLAGCSAEDPARQVWLHGFPPGDGDDPPPQIDEPIRLGCGGSFDGFVIDREILTCENVEFSAQAVPAPTAEITWSVRQPGVGDLAACVESSVPCFEIPKQPDGTLREDILVLKIEALAFRYEIEHVVEGEAACKVTVDVGRQEPLPCTDTNTTDTLDPCATETCTPSTGSTGTGTGTGTSAGSETTDTGTTSQYMLGRAVGSP
jgi:hypothetical protein